MSTVNDPESTFELLERLRAGEADALDELIRRYLPPLERWARGRLPREARDLGDTQDLIQDSILRTLKNLCRFRPEHEGALQAYLRQAVMNRIRDEVRRVRRRPVREELAEDLQCESGSPLEEAIGGEALARYEAALAALRPEDREAVVARVEMGQSYAELAETLGKPSVEAARVAVRRALVKLAAGMTPHAAGQPR
jgi:RNA polymerase sigma factor (sigma-70 family)